MIFKKEFKRFSILVDILYICDKKKTFRNQNIIIFLIFKKDKDFEHRNVEKFPRGP